MIHDGWEHAGSARHRALLMRALSQATCRAPGRWGRWPQCSASPMPSCAACARAPWGATPRQLLCNMRLQAAARLLRDPGIRIKEIQARVGVADASHFCRDFRDRFGMSPTDTRYQHGDANGLCRPRCVMALTDARFGLLRITIRDRIVVVARDDHPSHRKERADDSKPTPVRCQHRHHSLPAGRLAGAQPRVGGERRRPGSRSDRWPIFRSLSSGVRHAAAIAEAHRCARSSLHSASRRPHLGSELRCRDFEPRLRRRQAARSGRAALVDDLVHACPRRAAAHEPLPRDRSMRAMTRLEQRGLSGCFPRRPADPPGRSARRRPSRSRRPHPRDAVRSDRADLVWQISIMEAMVSMCGGIAIW